MAHYRGPAPEDAIATRRRGVVDADALSAHERWLASEEGGVRLEVEGARVVGAQAVGWDLRLASFVDAVFEGCDLTLLNASGFEAERCVFRRCGLEFAKLDGARLIGCRFEDCHAVGLHLEGARLDGGAFVATGLSRSSWGGAVAEGVEMRGTDLRRADLGGARFVECDLRGADLGEAVGGTFEDCAR